MGTEQVVIESLVRIATEGLCIGVLFNDEELNQLRGECEKKTQGEIIYPFKQMAKRYYALVIPLIKDFNMNIQGNGGEGYTSSPRESRFDIVLHARPSIVGVDYLHHAREKFLSYSFVTSEALSDDPVENLLAHADVKLMNMF